MDPRTGNIEQGPSRMGFDSNDNVPAKESTDESSSKNARNTPTRAENTTNHSFKGKKENSGGNGVNNVSPRRTNNEPSGSTQHQIYQSNNDNFPVHPVMDSGYGSVDKLKMNKSGPIRSPVMTRRLPNKMVEQTIKRNGSSFDSDEVGSDGNGSSGFVHIVGVSSSMKDTAYDYVRMKK